MNIEDKIYAGRGKTAQRLGLEYELFRPASAADPFANPVASIRAALNNKGRYDRANVFGDPLWYVDLDGRLTQPGDYLRRGDQIYFIATQQHLLPISCVECNRAVRLLRQAERIGVGAVGYGGISATESVTILGSAASWPCSITMGKKGQRNPEALPTGTAEQAGWLVLLPPSVPAAITISAGDRLHDDLGRIYVINAAEQSEAGWRIAVYEAHA